MGSLLYLECTSGISGDMAGKGSTATLASMATTTATRMGIRMATTAATITPVPTATLSRTTTAGWPTSRPSSTGES